MSSAELAIAARALAQGDAIAALKRIALRDDAPALALHGIAMAQLGELERARSLLERAARRFGAHDAVARSRCVVARAEIALAQRDFGAGGPDRALEAAIATLARHGDRSNAIHGRLVAARRWLVLGRVAHAARAMDGVALDGAPPRLAAIGGLVAAELAVRQQDPARARAALQAAQVASARAGIVALRGELAALASAIDAPAARCIEAGQARAIGLDEVAAVRASDALVVDACRCAVHDRDARAALATRPVLFALARALGAAWPDDVARDALIAAAFGARRPNESHRARLRVEIGRLRRELASLAELRATPRGFALVPRRGRVVVLAPLDDGPGAALRALLGDGAAWSTPALALALQLSQRTVQRTLRELADRGEVVAHGDARARRWTTPVASALALVLFLPQASA